jgi:glyoxylase-like metal-dependent hydrolase (beta-lactamase superfamily II)
MTARRWAALPNLWRLQEPYWTAIGGPRLYDLDPEPYGPFEASLPLTDHGDVVVLPTPGHTRGHVAIAVRISDLTLLFTGDHLIRQSWYAADLTRGMQPTNFIAKLTADTNRRLQRFVTEYPTLVLPTHDAEAANNLARWEPKRPDSQRLPVIPNIGATSGSPARRPRRRRP